MRHRQITELSHASHSTIGGDALLEPQSTHLRNYARIVAALVCFRLLYVFGWYFRVFDVARKVCVIFCAQSCSTCYYGSNLALSFRSSVSRRYMHYFFGKSSSYFLPPPRPTSTGSCMQHIMLGVRLVRGVIILWSSDGFLRPRKSLLLSGEKLWLNKAVRGTVLRSPSSYEARRIAIDLHR